MSLPTGSHPTLIAALLPPREGGRTLRLVVLAVLGSAFVAVCAQIQVPLQPVPITGQTFGVLIVGMTFGWRLGAATLLLYLAEGAVGIPVFAQLSAGPAVIAGPTGGYIVGFVLAAGLVGYLAERGWDRNFWLTALAMLIGNIAIYLPGVPWLAVWYAGSGAEFIGASGAETPLGAAIATGVMPFLLGDALKLALAARLMPFAWRLKARLGRAPLGRPGGKGSPPSA
ncbi:MAG: biotin transporter BioY [Alphaproteobacteria bacterium]